MQMVSNAHGVCDCCDEKIFQEQDCFMWEQAGHLWCSQECFYKQLESEGYSKEEVKALNDYDEDGELAIFYTTYSE